MVGLETNAGVQAGFTHNIQHIHTVVLDLEQDGHFEVGSHRTHKLGNHDVRAPLESFRRYGRLNMH